MRKYDLPGVNLHFDSVQEMREFDFREASEKQKSYRILYMGCPEFSLPPLRALIEEGFNVVGLATQPDRPVGRKQILTPTPAKVLADQHSIPVYQWEKLSEDLMGDDLAKIKPDLIITSAYGNILPKLVLDYPKYGCLNIHPSLLPRWRGASPVASSIIAGDEETALSIILMGEGLDDGDIVASCRYPISETINQEELTEVLGDLSAELLIGLLTYWYRGELELIVQDEKEVTYAEKLSREDGLLNFHKSARENANLVRGLYPWPGAYTFHEGKRYKVYQAQALESEASYKPGTVVRDGEKLIVACKDGLLSLEIIQGPSGKKLSACDCYHNFAEGACFE